MNREMIDVLKNLEYSQWWRPSYREESRGAIAELIKMGLIAGDHSRPYLTDAGVEFLAVLRRLRVK